MDKKRKIAITMIFILTFCVIGLITNKMRITILNNENNKNIINKTLEIKERLLKGENNKNGYTIKGKINLSNEKILDEIELGLYRNDEKIKIAYLENGEYNFKNIEKGKYEIKIENNNNYIIINNASDIEVTDKDVEVNIELNKVSNFEPKIKKYIKEIKINNNGKESIYTYTKENKVNLPIKNLKNLTGEVKYEFEVTNTSEKEGYVKIIKDIMPKGLTFNKEKNKEWKEKEGKLYTNKLSSELIKVGETKKVELILDIENTNEAKSYLNKVSITGEIYHNVQLMRGKEVYKNISVLEGEKVEEEIIEEENYVFKGWYKDKDFKEKFDIDEPITEDIKIYAKMNRKLNVKYVIGEEIYKEEIIEEGEKTNRPVSPVIKEYTFEGWYSDSELTKKYDFDKTIEEDTIIYGKIVKDEVEKVTITYYIDNEVNGEIEVIEKGNIITEREIEDTEGYTFTGWYSDSSLTTKFDFTKPIEQDTSIYGSMIKNKSNYNIKYTIIDGEEEKNIIDESREENTDIIYIEPEAKKSIEEEKKITTYQFDKWYSDKEMTQEYDFEKDNKLIKDTRLYGKYIETKACKTIENTKIPTKEEIISSLKSKEEIIKEVEDNYIPINLTNDNSNITTNADGTITVNGFKLEYTDKTNTELKIIGYSGSDNDISIPDTVNNIPITYISDAFSDPDRATTYNSIKISKTLKYINNYSFSGITINELDFSNAINLLEITASFNAVTLDTLDFKNAVNLQTLSSGVFSNSNINKVHFSNTYSLSTITSGIFNGVTVNEIYLDNSINLTTINNSSFTGTIKKIDFGNMISIEEIDYTGVFSGNIDEVNFNNTISLKTINNGAFAGPFKNVDFGNSINLTNIGPGTFNGLTVDTLNLSKLFSLENIETGVFASRPKIGRVILGTGVKNIKPAAFSSSNIEEVDFECAENLISIEINAFADNNIEVANISNLNNFTSLHVEAFNNNKLTEYSLVNLPKLTNIVSSASNSSSYDHFTTKDTQFDLIIDNIGVEALNNSAFETMMYDGLRGTSSFKPSPVKNVTIKNNGNLTEISNKAFFSVGTGDIIIENNENLKNISYLAFSSSSAENIIIENDPELETIGNAFIYNNAKKIVLRNLPKLTTIGDYAFEALVFADRTNASSNLKELVMEDLPSLTTIGKLAFRGNEFETIELTGENTPNLTTIGSTAFETHVGSHVGKEGYLKTLIIKDLPKLNITLNFSSVFDTDFVENVVLENLPSLTDLISIWPCQAQDFSLIVRNCESLSNFDPQIGPVYPINLVLENLPLVTTINKFDIKTLFPSKLENLDLSKLGNLETIETNVFNNGWHFKTVKLPASLKTIESGAFEFSTIDCIEILGDNTRFNDVWESIGFPSTLSPSTCIFTDNNVDVTISSLLADIINSNNKIDNKVFNLILYKMDDKTLINNDSEYILKKYDGKTYTNINLSEVVEDYGRYTLSEDDSDIIKAYNNKIYIDNLTEGTYKLVNKNNNNDTLTFIVESNGDVTGGAKLNNSNKTNNLISESEAEFITSIQTGGFKSKYLLILISIMSILYILFIYQKRKITNK